MLAHEFCDLMGRTTSLEEYLDANAVYMQVDMDKREFCAEWKKFGGSRIIKELSNKASRCENGYHTLRKRLLSYRKALLEKPSLESVEVKTKDGQWCSVDLQEEVFEYQQDLDDEESYVSGSFSIDCQKVEGYYVSEEFHGKFELPPLVKRTMELLGYDTSEL